VIMEIIMKIIDIFWISNTSNMMYFTFLACFRAVYRQNKGGLESFLAVCLPFVHYLSAVCSPFVRQEK